MLRHAQIRTKVLAILALPLAGLVALAAAGIGTSLNRGTEAGHRNELAQLAVRGNTLVHELQAERTLSSDWVSAKRKRTAIPSDGMLAQRVVVDRTASALEGFVGRLDTTAYNPRVRQALDPALKRLRGLQSDRQAIDLVGSSTTPEAVEATYNGLVSALLDLNAAIAVGSDDEALFRSVSAFVALSRLKDTTDLERGFRVSELLAPDPGQRRTKRFISLVTQRDSWLAQLRASATPAQLAHYEASVNGPEAVRAERIEQLALSGSAAELHAIGIGEQVDRIWFAAMTERVNKLRRVERELAANLLATSRSIQSSANRDTVRWLVGVSTLLLVTFLLSLVIARSLITPLRKLQDTAEDVARRQLPQAVERIQQVYDPDQGQMPTPGLERPFDTSAKDEISRVARSFNAAHDVAIRVASEQAALRRSIADMFQNLAQRTQILLRRTLALVDELEQDETRPDTLEQLFQVDHLITRMRRNAENLIVLSGANMPNAWKDPVPLSVLIRSAIAEVEDYKRVEPMPISDLQVVGHATVDVIHLLAELIENATTFSPPGTAVTVALTSAANGQVVEIEDKGVGMTDEQLTRANRDLADPPAVDSALTQRLGLHVVARLAQRHGIRVQLRHSWFGGMTALVLLPEHLLVHPTATGTAGLRSGQPIHHVGSAVSHGGTVAIMPPLPARTSRPATQPNLPPRHGGQPVPDEPQAPSYELPVPDGQWSQPQPAPYGDDPGVPPSASGLPQRTPGESWAPELGSGPPSAGGPGGTAAPDRPPPDPDRASRTMSSYMTGVTRGRTAQLQPGDPDEPPTEGRRSDDVAPPERPAP
jgi:signal transduction histidine kinase